MAPSLFLQLCEVLSRYRRRCLFALGMVLLSNLLLVLNPLLFRYAIILYDRTMVEGLPGWTSAYPWAVVLILIASFSAWLKYRMRVLFIGVSREAEAELRVAIFDRIQAHAQPFFDRHRIGGLMSRLVNDIAIYREVLGPGLLYPAYFVTKVIPAIVVLFIIAPRLAFVSLIPILAIPPLMFLIRGVLYRYSKAAQETLADMSTLAQEVYSSIRLVKCYGREGGFSKRFQVLCRGFFRLSLRLLAAEKLFYPLLRVIGKGVTILLVLVAGYLMLGGWNGLSTADLVSFMWIQSLVLLPVLLLGWMLPLYQRGRGAYARLYELYTEPLDVVEEENPIDVIPDRPSLTCTNLSFTYPATQLPALANITLELTPGRLIGLTGPPGSGKSSLFHLLVRDYPLPDGMLMVQQCDLNQYALSPLRRTLVTVEQEPFLFSRTLAENIALGCPDATPAAIEAAAKAAGLHDAITRFPQQYETRVGERGVTLSGGQKARVALARALVMNPPVLLLDDSFAALDVRTADTVMRSLRSKVNTTILLISHRVALLHQVDELIVLRHGRISEQGPPTRLARAGGYYAALVELEQILEKYS